MAKPITNSTPVDAATPRPFQTHPSEKKVQNAFEILMQPKPKKTTPCKKEGCQATAYLVFRDTTCNKCHKAYCKTHIPEDAHHCQMGDRV